MKHNRKDYDRIQDPEGLIPKDEPVFLLRGKDAYTPATVRYWANKILEPYVGTVVPDHIQEMHDSTMRFATEIEEWQNANGSKEPDVPDNSLRS